MRRPNLVMVCVLVAMTSGATVMAQPQWSSKPLDVGGKEFRLRNDAGASIILVCVKEGIVGGFEFPDEVEQTDRLWVRGVPGSRQNVWVSNLGEKILQIAGGRGIDYTLRQLQGTAKLLIRVGDARADFDVFGSAQTVSECIEQVEAPPGSPVGAYPMYKRGALPGVNYTEEITDFNGANGGNTWPPADGAAGQTLGR